MLAKKSEGKPTTKLAAASRCVTGVLPHLCGVAFAYREPDVVGLIEDLFPSGDDRSEVRVARGHVRGGGCVVLASGDPQTCLGEFDFQEFAEDQTRSTRESPNSR